jgi:hypothetical protein
MLRRENRQLNQRRALCLNEAQGRPALLLEPVVRAVTVIFAGIVSLGFVSPSLARETYLHKRSIEDIKSICDKVGGEFSRDSRGYGCGTNCKGGPGTACVVYCPTGQRCIAQVIGARRPTSVQNALEKGHTP